MDFIRSFSKKKRQVKSLHGGPESSIPSVQESSQMLGLAAVFPFEELVEATNNFDSSKLLGCGSYGRVYLGKLGDGRSVAIKKLKDDHPELVRQFFNEVAVLSRISHPNLVTLHGCSRPHGRELLLVYEFVPNGTLEEHLHKQRPPLSWGLRMQIAIQTAKVLSYLHSREPAIIHRDVKTANILLDNDFNVKVADLGICRLMPWDTTTVTTAPQGTVGSRDPEYEKYYKLTDKSDVYSFGVLLLELITGKMAIDVNRGTDEIYLVNMALNKIRDKELEKLIELDIGYDSDGEVKRMINTVAQLASWCLRTKGAMRPPMGQVLTILNGIRDGTHHLNGTDIELKEVEVVVEARIFSFKELEKATNYFSQEIGDGKNNKVYLGKLGDGGSVAVKVLKNRTIESLKSRFNDVRLVSPLRHKNLVTVHGCTKPQNREMLEVYEYVPNGTVAFHLHSQRAVLDWSVRLQIAIETAEAMVYLLSSENLIGYLNVKTSNILLDSSFHVKVSGVHTWNVPSTVGFRNPDDTQRRKTDVYMFGVVLVELLTRKQVECINDDLREFDLVIMAVTKIINKEMEKLLDPELGYHSDSEVRRMINSVANLAFRCLQRRGLMRPSMFEVLTLLKRIRDGSKEILKEVDVLGHFNLESIFLDQELDVTLKGFEAAYVGYLDGQMVAVEVLSCSWFSDQQTKWPAKLFSEVMIISRLRHENLVTLYGCTDPRIPVMFFVREHVSNGSVAVYLYHNRRLTLGWALRIQIAIETAEALSYLHSLEPPVVHCNVATYTIMLDDNFHVKLGGLNLWTRWTTDVCIGYLGFVDPTIKKCKSFELITVKSDIYSFGVVLFQLISGKGALDRSCNENLADWAIHKIQNNELDVLMDVKLDYRLKEVISSVAELALRCTLPEANMRPSIVEVLAALKEIRMDGNKHELHEYT